MPYWKGGADGCSRWESEEGYYIEAAAEPDSTKYFRQAYYTIEKLKWGSFMNCNCRAEQLDLGSKPYVANINGAAIHNQNFRTAIWTGCHLQMTLMCIPPGGEIGLESHPNTDQFIRVEQGCAVVKMGKCKNQLDFQQNICMGDGVFVPAGTWHNMINIGGGNLKVSSIYAPSNHPRGTVHYTKADAEQQEYYNR